VNSGERERERRGREFGGFWIVFERRGGKERERERERSSMDSI